MNAQFERYQRQILLKEFGEAAQQKLLHAKVLVIGAGGLGCPALQYLAAAGVGTIGIVDDDIVTLTNLHRQILYSTDDIGQPKAERAAFKLQQLNPDITITPYNFRLANKNALNIISDYDIIIDGTDNFSSRYMINDACVLLNKALVYGAISRFEGQVAIFNCKTDDEIMSVNYRDLFPDPPKDGTILNCAEEGVLGVLPGIIGCMQASETIKLITGIGKPLINRLLTYNALTNQFYELALSPNKESAALIPQDEEEFTNTDYDWLCSAHAINKNFEIDPLYFNKLLKEKNITIIDVREPGEIPAINEFPHAHIPLGQLQQQASSLKGDIIITICQSGVRSVKAAIILSEKFGTTKKIFSLQGGIINWKNYQLKQQYVE
ncbi:MAG TPA: HesA/MoeB/ThiF family protein [Chitinophagaceae bacterium]|nr:HesA/MoeB/ThiF family protein [Chitinophagaceae bacterium]